MSHPTAIIGDSRSYLPMIDPGRGYHYGISQPYQFISNSSRTIVRVGFGIIHAAKRAGLYDRILYKYNQLVLPYKTNLTGNG